MILADIGNRFAHIKSNSSVQDLEIEELFKNYSNAKVCYINVNNSIKLRLKNFDNWIDLSKFVELDGAYRGMGIDRQVFCLSYENALFVDAGSAITIDLVKDGKFIGGTIVPGLWKLKDAFAQISPSLKIDEIKAIDISSLPNTNTKDTINYGIIAPIIALIVRVREDLPIYFTGGDGKFLSQYFDNATYDRELIFKSMEKIARRAGC